MSAQEEIERAYRLVCDESRDASQEGYRRDLTARAEAYAHALQLLRAEACDPENDRESITEALFRIDAERKQAERAEQGAGECQHNAIALFAWDTGFTGPDFACTKCGKPFWVAQPQPNHKGS